MFVGLVCIASAFATEAMQFLSATRHPQLLDACVKATGAGLGASISAAGNLVILRASRFRQNRPAPDDRQ
jgi:hypothetical protein